MQFTQIVDVRPVAQKALHVEAPNQRKIISTQKTEIILLKFAVISFTSFQ